MNHRIIERLVLEGTLKIIWFQPPCHEQGHLPPDQVAQSSIQPGLEHCQAGGSHSFSGQPVPVFHHPGTGCPEKLWMPTPWKCGNQLLNPYFRGKHGQELQEMLFAGDWGRAGREGQENLHLPFLPGSSSTAASPRRSALHLFHPSSPQMAKETSFLETQMFFTAQ